jgi:hypothetical protein
VAGVESWLREGEDYPDPEVTFEDIESFVDPIIVTRAIGDLKAHEMALEESELKTTLLGIQVHVCPLCEPGKVYVMDRINVVSFETGMCLVCGQETTV